MSANDQPPAIAAITQTLGELDGGSVLPSERPGTPVGSDEVPVPVRESSGGSGSSDVELLWEVGT
jgi:hypothetical protein